MVGQVRLTASPLLADRLAALSHRRMAHNALSSPLSSAFVLQIRRLGEEGVSSSLGSSLRQCHSHCAHLRLLLPSFGLRLR